MGNCKDVELYVNLIKYGIDYDSYFNVTCDYQEYIDNSASEDNNNEDQVPYYNSVESIDCRISGTRDYIPGDDGTESMSSMTYKTIKKIKQRDKINGQIVLRVKPVYEFDGEISMYKAYV